MLNATSGRPTPAARSSRSTPRCRCARSGATARGWSTTDGHEWLDAYGGHAVASTGHCHPDVVRAIAEQAAQLLFYSTAVPHPQREELAERWPRSVPTRSAGSSSATRARRPTRTRCTWRGGTPGGRRSSRCAAGGTAARPRRSRAPTGRATRQAPGAPACRSSRKVPFDDVAALDAAVDDTVAAVMVEPVQGFAGRARLLARVPRGRPPRLRRARRGR